MNECHSKQLLKDKPTARKKAQVRRMRRGKEGSSSIMSEYISGGIRARQRQRQGKPRRGVFG